MWSECWRFDNGSQYLPIHLEDLKNGVDYGPGPHPRAGAFRREVTAVHPGCPEPWISATRASVGVPVTAARREGQAGFSVSPEFIPMALREMRSEDLDITGLDTLERVRNAVLPLETLCQEA